MSKFTWKDLLDLNSKERSYSSGLSCIAHIDMNAFFAQVEQIRCGFTADDPVVCVQWNSLIAVSYAARKYGIGRMDTAGSAKEKCPHVLLCHAAVFKKNENFWSYKPVGTRLNPMQYKVSLEPYRREGRKVLKLFKTYTELVEKASVDEAFIDLGKLIFQKILLPNALDFEENTKEDGTQIDPFQMLKEKFIKGDYSLEDPLPDISLLDLGHLEVKGNIVNPNGLPLIQDWDDVVIALGSHITMHIRDKIKATLGYTTSCGVSQSKSISKLASDFLKPNAQTIVLPRLVNDFLDSGKLEITNFWTLGGSRGKDVLEILGIPKEQGHSIKYIRDTWNNQQDLRSFFELKYKDYSLFKKFSFNFEDCNVMSEKLVKLCRGQWKEVVNPKPVVKTMMANKNMRGNACASVGDCIEWFRVFSGELADRIAELETEYNKVITPKTLTISLTGSKHTNFLKQSKNVPFNKISHNFTLNSSDGNENDNDNDKISAKKQYIKSFGDDILNQATKLMTEWNKTLTYQSVYPLRNISLALSNMTIVEAGSTIFDMLNNSKIKAKRLSNEDNQEIASDFVDGTSNPNTLNLDTSNLDTLNLDTSKPENSSQVNNENIYHFFCSKCEKMIDGTSEKLTHAEHMDFHYASELSKGLNGYDRNTDYEHLTYAERRLLFRDEESENKSNNNNNNTTTKKVNKPVPKKGTSKNNILKFFNVKKD